MSALVERPVLGDAPITGARTWLAAAALYEFVGWIWSLVGYADLPELVNVQATTYGREVQVHAQLATPHDDANPERAAQVLAWRHAVPDGHVTLTGHRVGTSGEYWRATVHVPAGLVELWTHVQVTEEQAERLESQPEAAYAVLVELAAAGQ
jgi:hypothetical protein